MPPLVFSNQSIPHIHLENNESSKTDQFSNYSALKKKEVRPSIELKNKSSTKQSDFTSKTDIEKKRIRPVINIEKKD